jgi:hypothetical protein
MIPTTHQKNPETINKELKRTHERGARCSEHTRKGGRDKELNSMGTFNKKVCKVAGRHAPLPEQGGGAVS